VQAMVIARKEASRFSFSSPLNWCSKICMRPCFAFGQVMASQSILFLCLKPGGENLFRCTNQDEKDLVLIAIFKNIIFWFY
jgi:hypothetical protein